MTRGDERTALSRMDDWNHRQWNERLFVHHFDRQGSPGPLRPVTSVCVVDEEFANIVGVSLAHGAAARDAFVRTIRDALRNTRSDLCGHALAAQHGWNTGLEEPPPFFGHLVLSCLAMSEVGASSSEIADDRSYAARISRVAGAHTQHPPDRLPELWQQVVDWLRRANEQLVRPRYRELVLPSPGGLTRIGYSYRLAFPSGRDLAPLRAVLAPCRNGLEEVSPMRVIGLLRRSSHQLTPELLDRLEDFETDLANGTEGPSRSGFWSAVERALVVDADAAARGVDVRTCFALLGEYDTDDELTFHVCSDGPSAPPGVTATPLPARLGSWTHLLARHPGRPQDLTNQVFALQVQLPGITAYIKGGVVPLRREHQFLAIAIDVDDQVDLFLVRDALVPKFQTLLASKRSHTRPSSVTGWTEIEGSTLVPQRSRADLQRLGLVAAMYLVSSDTGRQITIRGGIRLPDGFLALPRVLPRFKSRAPSLVFEREQGPAGSSVVLAREGDEHVVPHGFDVEPGAYVVRAPGNEVRSVRVRFSEGPVHLVHVGDEPVGIVEGVVNAAPAGDREAWLSTDRSSPPELTPASGRRRHVTISDVRAEPSSAVWKVHEALAAIHTRRSSFSLGEWYQLLHAAGLPSAGLIASRLTRAWCETGVVDMLMHPDRRAVRIAPSVSRLVVVGAQEARIVGVVPAAFKTRLKGAAQALGLRVEPICSVSAYVAPMLSVRATASDGADRWAELASALQLERRFLRHDFRPEPLDLSEPRAGFQTASEQKIADLVVRHRRHLQGATYWELVRAGRTLYWSHVKNLVWLRVAHRELTRDETSVTATRAYLPLPIARHVACTSAVLQGPVDDGAAYRYVCDPRWRPFYSAMVANLYRGVS